MSIDPKFVELTADVAHLPKVGSLYPAKSDGSLGLSSHYRVPTS